MHNGMRAGTSGSLLVPAAQKMDGRRAGTSSKSRKVVKVKVVDLYQFEVEVSRDEAAVLNQVKERVKEQGRVWWATEASKGAGWYLQPDVSSLTESNLLSHLALSNFTDTGHLKKLIRKGIPPALRGKVWRAVSGAIKKRSTVPDSYYQDLIEAVQGKETPATRQIDHDLDRTFPCHPVIDSPEGQASLRRILIGYSFRDCRVGYCQGMNFVAASLLLVMKTEEEAFWMLAVLLENILYHDSYSENLYGCHVEQRVFKDLFKKKCPRLATHLDNIDFDVSLVTTEWFLCLFAKACRQRFAHVTSVLPKTTMRVWDVLFNEGAGILFRVALAFFKIKEEQLLRARHVGEAINILQEATHNAYDPEEVLTVAFEKLGVVSTQNITKQREKEQPAVMAELERQVQRLNHCDDEPGSNVFKQQTS